MTIRRTQTESPSSGGRGHTRVHSDNTDWRYKNRFVSTGTDTSDSLLSGDQAQRRHRRVNSFPPESSNPGDLSVRVYPLPLVPPIPGPSGLAGPGRRRHAPATPERARESGPRKSRSPAPPKMEFESPPHPDRLQRANSLPELSTLPSLETSPRDTDQKDNTSPPLSRSRSLDTSSKNIMDRQISTLTVPYGAEAQSSPSSRRSRSLEPSPKAKTPTGTEERRIIIMTATDEICNRISEYFEVKGPNLSSIRLKKLPENWAPDLLLADLVKIKQSKKEHYWPSTYKLHTMRPKELKDLVRKKKMNLGWKSFLAQGDQLHFEKTLQPTTEKPKSTSWKVQPRRRHAGIFQRPSVTSRGSGAHLTLLEHLRPHRQMSPERPEMNVEHSPPDVDAPYGARRDSSDPGPPAELPRSGTDREISRIVRDYSLHSEVGNNPPMLAQLGVELAALSGGSGSGDDETNSDICVIRRSVHSEASVQDSILSLPETPRDLQNLPRVPSRAAGLDALAEGEMSLQPLAPQPHASPPSAHMHRTPRAVYMGWSAGKRLQVYTRSGEWVGGEVQEVSADGRTLFVRFFPDATTEARSKVASSPGQTKVRMLKKWFKRGGACLRSAQLFDFQTDISDIDPMDLQGSSYPVDQGLLDMERKATDDSWDELNPMIPPGASSHASDSHYDHFSAQEWNEEVKYTRPRLNSCTNKNWTTQAIISKLRHHGDCKKVLAFFNYQSPHAGPQIRACDDPPPVPVLDEEPEEPEEQEEEGAVPGMRRTVSRISINSRSDVKSDVEGPDPFLDPKFDDIIQTLTPHPTPRQTPPGEHPSSAAPGPASPRRWQAEAMPPLEHGFPEIRRQQPSLLPAVPIPEGEPSEPNSPTNSVNVPTIAEASRQASGVSAYSDNDVATRSTSESAGIGTTLATHASGEVSHTASEATSDHGHRPSPHGPPKPTTIRSLLESTSNDRPPRPPPLTLPPTPVIVPRNMRQASGEFVRKAMEVASSRGLRVEVKSQETTPLGKNVNLVLKLVDAKSAPQAPEEGARPAAPSRVPSLDTGPQKPGPRPSSNTISSFDSQSSSSSAGPTPGYQSPRAAKKRRPHIILSSPHPLTLGGPPGRQPPKDPPGSQSTRSDPASRSTTLSLESRQSGLSHQLPSSQATPPPKGPMRRTPSPQPPSSQCAQEPRVWTGREQVLVAELGPDGTTVKGWMDCIVLSPEDSGGRVCVQLLDKDEAIEADVERRYLKEKPTLSSVEERSIVVHACGTKAVRGIYRRVEDFQFRAQWRMERWSKNGRTNYFIQFRQGRWRIRSDPGYQEHYYHTDATNLPPTGGWVVASNGTPRGPQLIPPTRLDETVFQQLRREHGWGAGLGSYAPVAALNNPSETSDSGSEEDPPTPRRPPPAPPVPREGLLAPPVSPPTNSRNSSSNGRSDTDARDETASMDLGRRISDIRVQDGEERIVFRELLHRSGLKHWIGPLKKKNFIEGIEKRSDLRYLMDIVEELDLMYVGNAPMNRIKARRLLVDYGIPADHQLLKKGG